MITDPMLSDHFRNRFTISDPLHAGSVILFRMRLGNQWSMIRLENTSVLIVLCGSHACLLAFFVF